MKKKFSARDSIPLSSDLNKVTKKFAFSITSEMAEIINAEAAEDPVAKQFIPDIRELDIDPNELADPIGDSKFTAVKGIIHRYPDRCLLMPVQVCPVYCRFCFRREQVGQPQRSLTPKQIETACDYIANNHDIWEVILTGGDPLILKPAYIARILNNLAKISHVEVVRIHTRVPLVDPSRIHTELLEILNIAKTVYIVLHVNHAKEFTPAGVDACRRILNAGIPMLSQTTLLRGINDDINSLSELMRCMVKNRIKPYYLHHPDLAQGTKHFRVSIAHGQSLMRQLRGRFSGLCQPTYVLDVPGGHGKMPIGHQYCQREHLGYEIEDYHGEKHYYEDV